MALFISRLWEVQYTLGGDKDWPNNQVTVRFHFSLALHPQCLGNPPRSLTSVEEAQKHLACPIQWGIHVFKSPGENVWISEITPFPGGYQFHEFSNIRFLPTLVLQDSLQMDILLAIKDCQNFRASYGPYMGHDYRILCHRNRLESGEPTIFGKPQDYLKPDS